MASAGVRCIPRAESPCTHLTATWGTIWVMEGALNGGVLLLAQGFQKTVTWGLLIVLMDAAWKRRIFSSGIILFHNAYPERPWASFLGHREDPHPPKQRYLRQFGACQAHPSRGLCSCEVLPGRIGKWQKPMSK